MSPLKEERQALQLKLLEALVDYEYRHQRYNISYSICIGYTLEPIDMNQIAARTRKTDKYVVLHDNLCAVIFDCADDEKGIKAANNLLTYFQHAYFSKSLYASVVTSDEFNNPSQMVSKLFDLLDYAIRHNMDNHIMDCSQIMKGI